MTLENLLRVGRLKAHDADASEIARLLDAASLALRDAGVDGLSVGGRMDHAYRALMQSALAALYAHGFRPASSEPGHHQLVLQLLPKTAGLAAERVAVLDAFRKARNQSAYRGFEVSEATVRECIVEARRVLEAVRARLDGRG